GPHKGQILRGIYLLEGDMLKVCRSDPGQARPREFTTWTDSGQTLFVSQREKVKAAPPPPPPANPFVDKHLEEAIREALHEPKERLTDERLANLSVLEAAGKNIRDLRGLEKCPNVALINLAKNQVADLTPLKGLTNLQSLNLAGNKVSDLKPLAGLTGLQYLE